MKTFFTKQILMLTSITCLVGLAGCDIKATLHEVCNRNMRGSTIVVAKSTTPLWSRLRGSFCLNLSHNNSYVQLHLDKYKKQDQYLQKVTKKASPYLSQILAELEKRQMPGELALLPMIESSFDPHARSEMGATGIWQLLASTGKRFGLKQTASWSDPRKDVSAATKAALNYLQFLHAEFNGDWFLALAAYNAGEGRVKRAINQNLAANKPTDFWSLSLPKQTKHFVPKLLALAGLIKYAHISDRATIKQRQIPYVAMANTRGVRPIS